MQIDAAIDNPHRPSRPGPIAADVDRTGDSGVRTAAIYDWPLI
jgi:hypothetical protein